MMHKLEKCTILDEVDEVMYLTNIEDYSLIFLNEKLKQMIQIKDEDYVGKKCYEVIHDRKAPCEFCQKFKLSRNKFESQKKYIEHFNGYFNIKAKAIPLYDDYVRLIIADDITEIERRIIAEESIYNFINNLSKQKNLDNSIDKVLEEICNYYQGDRGYLFDIDFKNQEVNNTHEYSKVGVEPQIKHLQHVPLDVITRWIEIFKKQGFIFIDSLDNELDKNSDEYRILKDQQIDRLLAYPFYIEDRLIGFIGIDNPKYDYYDITLLKSISFFVFYDMTRREEIKKLEVLSSYDTLTGLKNRNSYIHQIDLLEEKTPETIGIIYIDLNGLKDANDKFGHEYGDMRLKNVAKVIRKFFEGNSYRVGGDEFVIIITNINKNRFVENINILLEAFNEDKSINISIGYVYEENPLGIETLITKADELMYQEKLKYYEKIKKNN